MFYPLFFIGDVAGFLIIRVKRNDLIPFGFVAHLDTALSRFALKAAGCSGAAAWRLVVVFSRISRILISCIVNLILRLFLGMTAALSLTVVV